MREIKFRQWMNGHFHYWGIGISTDGVKCSFVGPCSGGTIRADRTPQEQFTGLTDRNGAEIYEGDIVGDHVGIGAVKYSGKHGAFRVCYWDGLAKWFYDYCLNGERESVEIIGNIHQNPELLK